jgi:excisionase family DNA binding protein
MTNWLTVTEAAEYAKISARLIRVAVKQGDLPAYAIGAGKDYRLTAEQVDAWMMSRAYEPKATSA